VTTYRTQRLFFWFSIDDLLCGATYVLQYTYVMSSIVQGLGINSLAENETKQKIKLQYMYRVQMRRSNMYLFLHPASTCTPN